jgi:hypothetical protein
MANMASWSDVTWTSVDDLWSVQEEAFDGGFETVRRKRLHKSYESIVEDALGKGKPPAHPRLLKSESSCSNNSANLKTTIFGFPNAEGAHLIPQAPICSPVYGIFSQAIVGVDIERRLGSSPADRSNLIETLQQVVCGRVSADRADTGLRYAPSNLLWLPKPHTDTFDALPVLIVVPILPLSDVKGWAAEIPNWVMVVAGRCAANEDNETNDWWRQVQTG